MQIRFSHLAPTIFILLAGCSDNNLGVGEVDAAPDVSTGGSGGTPAGSGGAGSGGLSTGGAGGTSGPSTSSTGGMDGLSGGNDGGLDASAADGGGTCDPLAPAPKPIALATILGVGRSADGTVYVVDDNNGSQRAFVSDTGGTLVRQPVAGGGSTSDSSGIEYIIMVTDVASPFVLEVDVAKSGAVRMGVLQGILTDRKSFVIGQEGEELTVLPSSAIAAMPLRNLPGTVFPEYVVSLPDGQVMLVTRPTDDWTYADFRLFLGPTTAVVERAVASVTRYKDGGTTDIVFDLDGAQADAYFPVVSADAGFAQGPATLTIGSAVTPLTRDSTLPAAATYLCL